MKDILYLENIDAGYFKREVLHNVSMKIKENTTVLLIGPNGTGKSTLLKIIAGLLRPWKGKIVFEEREIDGLSPAQRTRMGISYFLQGGEIFRNLNVIENLQIAGTDLSKKKVNDGICAVFDLFPKLKTMGTRRAGLLSGGEKHQLALGMILIRNPKLVLLDEPSAGLSPLLVKEVLKNIKKMKQILNTSVLLVEQNVSEGLKIADTVFLMKAGSMVREATPEAVTSEGLLEQLFFE
jgi:ABC-type branched-subunit amino acid transport system ATPase component